MKIFVTGACGFIGSHVVEKLLRLNYKVKALTYYNARNSIGWLNQIQKNNNLTIISGDICDSNFIENETKNVDAIINLAALIAIPYSYKAPKSYLDTNILGTYNILRSAQKNKISNTIITSTSEVYGTAKYIPIDEIHPLNAQSPYAASKIGADQLALSFFKSFNLPLTILRPFNTFGPRQSARAIIPTIITQLLNKQKIIKLGNLSPTRDFTYIDDTVDGFIKVLKYKKKGEVINIGNKFEISIREILNILKNDFGFRFKVIQDKKRIRPKKSEVERLFSDNNKAKKLLKWKPNYAGIKGFKKGIQKTIDWFSKKENLNYYNSKNYNL
tara:strand:+ start:1842 stop:2828 length:987 start_codon:yes stop_codon:yes gene_type:complete